MRKIRNPFFQFRLFGGVLVDQLQAHVFGDLTCDLFFERRAYEFIQFRNAPFRPFEFFFDVRFVFVSEPSCAIIVSRLAKITPNISIISPYILLLLLKRVAKAKYWERQSSGSTMPIINIDIIKNAPIVIATEMESLNETINKFYRKIDNVLSENIKLLGLKNMQLIVKGISEKHNKKYQIT